MTFVITTTVDIDASRDEVWATLLDFPRYGEWSNFSSVQGAAEVGSRLRIRMPGFSFRPTVTAVVPGEKLQWDGTLLSRRLFHGEHSFLLGAGPGGTTRVVNEERFSGALTTLTQRFTRKGGDNGYTSFNAGLKRQAEGRSQARG